MEPLDPPPNNWMLAFVMLILVIGVTIGLHVGLAWGAAHNKAPAVHCHIKNGQVFDCS